MLLDEDGFNSYYTPHHIRLLCDSLGIIFTSMASMRLFILFSEFQCQNEMCQTRSAGKFMNNYKVTLHLADQTKE
jgi:hypothetical protein